MTRRLFGNRQLLEDLIQEYAPAKERVPEVRPLGGVGIVAREKGGGRDRIETRGVGTVAVADETFGRMLPAIAAGGSDGKSDDRDTREAYTLSSIHMDVPLAVASPVAHRPPVAAVGRARRAALATWRAASGLTGSGEGVGVVVVDEGYNEKHLIATAGATSATFGGGFQFFAGSSQTPVSPVGAWSDPYRRQAEGHGNMVARNILDLAPQATLFDAPVLPPRIVDLPTYTSLAAAVLHAVRTVIEDPAGHGVEPHDRWIVVNAWGVPNRFTDPEWASGQHPSYLANREHALNEAVIELSEVADVVFAAGNSGEHDPAPFSGPYDRGPGRSVWGANGLGEVTTVGATTLGTQIVAASSQGPSRPELMANHDPAAPGVNEKPDTYAPSWFHEDDDASVWNTGTSAAAALHAGRLAAG